MNEIAQAKKRLADTRLQAAKAQQDVLQVIQMQQSQIEQLKQAACTYTFLCVCVCLRACVRVTCSVPTHLDFA